MQFNPRNEKNKEQQPGVIMKQSFPNLHIIHHPLIQHKLTLMRMEETKSGQFRQLLREITFLMGYELTKDFPTKAVTIKTPIIETTGHIFDDHDVSFIPILRAGLGMADALRELMPTANEGHIGLYRDPITHHPVEYFVKLPANKDQMFIVLDPMLATGYSAVKAIEILLAHGINRKNIRFLALITVPEGITVFNEKFSDIPIYVAALDERLNENAYMIPGLGDAGDRLFGTK